MGKVMMANLLLEAALGGKMATQRLEPAVIMVAVEEGAVTAALQPHQVEVAAQCV